jgi:hypothetical protein
MIVGKLLSKGYSQLDPASHFSLSRPLSDLIYINVNSEGVGIPAAKSDQDGWLFDLLLLNLVSLLTFGE